MMSKEATIATVEHFINVFYEVSAAHEKNPDRAVGEKIDDNFILSRTKYGWVITVIGNNEIIKRYNFGPFELSIMLQKYLSLYGV